MKKKKIVFYGLVSTLLLGATAVIGSKGASIFTLAGGEEPVWNHYESLAATVLHNGCKEYWVNCSTHETVFTHPGGTPVEKGAATQAFADSLAANDDRVIAKTGRVLSFEDADDLNYVINGSRNTIASKVATADDGATLGSKALKIVTTASETFSCTFLQTYMDGLFADPEVVAVNFDAKASTACTKFSYQNSVTSPYEFDCCANDQAGYGLQLNWKTFSLTREMYNAATNKGILLCTVGNQLPVGGSIWIDNVRPVAKKLDLLGFEASRLVPNDGGEWYSKTASFRNFANKEIFVIGTNATAVDYGFDYSIKSEGFRSLKYHKESQKYVNLSMYNVGLAAGDSVTFDVRFTTAINTDATFRAGDGTGLGKVCNADTWYTFTIPYEHIKDGTLLAGFTGSPECDFYVDNVIINKAA